MCIRDRAYDAMMLEPDSQVNPLAGSPWNRYTALHPTGHLARSPVVSACLMPPEPNSSAPLVMVLFQDGLVSVLQAQPELPSAHEDSLLFLSLIHISEPTRPY
eukprot:TRINITY_DN17328_c0_g1_i1.p1 TRINITY_DN17328_c0_g1~~TRINITY_DN17328_c0_g1_i1.p1  ORF type:complete len:103 (-),score=19.13 TRINITY_DN17328_c0_g1_i1:85-393(-)